MGTAEYLRQRRDDEDRMRTAALALRHRVNALEKVLRQIADEATEDRIGAIAELALVADTSDPKIREAAASLTARVERLSAAPPPPTT